MVVLRNRDLCTECQVSVIRNENIEWSLNLTFASSSFLVPDVSFILVALHAHYHGGHYVASFDNECGMLD